MFKFRNLMLPELNAGFVKIFANMGWLFFQRAINILFSLTVGILVIRYLGPADFGSLSYAASILGIVGIISKLGLDGIIVRDMVKDPENEPEILGTVFTLRFILAVLGVGLVNLWIYLTEQADYQLRLIFFILSIGTALTSADVAVFWYRSKVLSKFTAMFAIAGAILGGLLKIYFILANLGVVYFALALIIEIAIYTIGPTVLFQFKSSYGLFSWRFVPEIAKRAVKETMPLALSAIFVSTYFKIDQVMLGSIDSRESLGVYAAAVRFSEIWYIIPLIITQSTFPHLIETYKNKNDEVFNERLQVQHNLVAQLAFVIAIVMTFFSVPLLGWLLGDGYQGAGIILSIHIWSAIFVFLEASRIRWLLVNELTIYQPLTTVFGAVSNIVLNLFLIPRFGGIGCAIATLISYALAVYGSCFFYPKIRVLRGQMTKALLSTLMPRRYLQSYRFVLSFASNRLGSNNES